MAKRETVTDNGAEVRAQLEATKAGLEAQLAAVTAERDEAREAKNILVSALDWFGEHTGLVAWQKSHRGETTIRVRAEGLQVETSYADPIDGFLEGFGLMQERLARRNFRTVIQP